MPVELKLHNQFSSRDMTCSVNVEGAQSINDFGDTTHYIRAEDIRSVNLTGRHNI